MSGDEDLFQKDVKLELSRFRTKTKPTLAEAVALRLEKADLDKKADVDRLKLIDLRLMKLTDDCSKEASSSCATIKQSLKNYKLDAKDPYGRQVCTQTSSTRSPASSRPRLKLWGDLSLEKKEVRPFPERQVLSP